MSAVVALRNLGHKALRRLFAVHKPFVRRAKRRGRGRELDAIVQRALAVEDELGRLAAGTSPIIAGPWLAEVGYEVLYWVPFLRWFADEYRVDASRLVALSRGGVGQWYQGIADRYLEIFDLVPHDELARLNRSRQDTEEGGGQKQFAYGGSLEQRLIDGARRLAGLEGASVLSPALMFRMFRDVWHGNIAAEFLWSRTSYVRAPRPARPVLDGLPASYVAVKVYSGRTLPATAGTRDSVREIVSRAARRMPVVVLETDALDDHADFDLRGVPNVLSARGWMTPRTNLQVQTAVIAHASHFMSTCGGLAWMAPFMGVPTTALYADDRLLAPHLLMAAHAGRQAGAAEFTPIDLRGWNRLGLVPEGDPPAQVSN